MVKRENGDQDPSALSALDADEIKSAGLAPRDAQHAWGAVCVSLARFAATALSLPGGSASVDAAVDVLHAIENVQDVQTAMLQSLKQEVDLLRAAPYKSALLLISEAARVGPTDARYQQFLDQASMHLYEAHPMCDSLEEEAVVDFHLGVVYVLLAKPSDASYWLLESCKSGRKVLEDLAARADDVKIVKHKSVAAVATLSSLVLWPVTVPAGAALLMKRHHDKKVTIRATAETIEQLAHFINAATECHNSIEPEKKVPKIGISRGRHGDLLIEEEEEVGS
jgi:hypothetical protein